MTAAAIQELLRRKPFEPFEVHMSNGEVFAIAQPEFAFVLKTKLFIGFPESDRFKLCMLTDIADIRPLQAA